MITAAYLLIVRRTVENERGGTARAEYGEYLIEHLAADFSVRFGRRFSVRNVWQIKAFHFAWPIQQTVSAELENYGILQTASAESSLVCIVPCFPLPWSAYVLEFLNLKDEYSKSDLDLPSDQNSDGTYGRMGFDQFLFDNHLFNGWSSGP